MDLSLRMSAILTPKYRSQNQCVKHHVRRCRRRTEFLLEDFDQSAPTIEALLAQSWSLLIDDFLIDDMVAVKLATLPKTSVLKVSSA